MTSCRATPLLGGLQAVKTPLLIHTVHRRFATVRRLLSVFVLWALILTNEGREKGTAPEDERERSWHFTGTGIVANT